MLRIKPPLHLRQEAKKRGQVKAGPCDAMMMCKSETATGRSWVCVRLCVYIGSRQLWPVRLRFVVYFRQTLNGIQAEPKKEAILSSWHRERASLLTRRKAAKMHNGFHRPTQLPMRSSCCQPAVNILLAAQEIRRHWWHSHVHEAGWSFNTTAVFLYIRWMIHQALCEIWVCFILYLCHMYTISHFHYQQPIL